MYNPVQYILQPSAKMTDHPDCGAASLMDSAMHSDAHQLNMGRGAYDSGSCKNTPFVARKLDTHHRPFRPHTGTQSAQSSPLPHRRLDKLEGVIREKPAITSAIPCTGFKFDDSCKPTNSPLTSRKLFLGQVQNCNCHSGSTSAQRSGALFPASVPTTKEQTANTLNDIEVCNVLLSTPLRYRRRVESDSSRQNGQLNHMTKSDYSASDMSLMPLRRTDDILFGGNGCHSPITSVLGEPGVFASPARIIPNQQRPVKYKGGGNKSIIVEQPMTNGEPDQSILSGWLKFRDNKRVSGN